MPGTPISVSLYGRLGGRAGLLELIAVMETIGQRLWQMLAFNAGR